MPISRRQDIWIEQCDAAKAISTKFGLKAAFDYLIVEKLMAYADAAFNHPEFARELPRFVAAVREIFSAQEMQDHLARIEREQAAAAQIELDEDEEEFPEDPAKAERRAMQYELVKNLLTASQLGTS